MRIKTALRSKDEKYFSNLTNIKWEEIYNRYSTKALKNYDYRHTDLLPKINFDRFCHFSTVILAVYGTIRKHETGTYILS